jgi:carboxynorspermidine decarboxylase
VASNGDAPVEDVTRAERSLPESVTRAVTTPAFVLDERTVLERLAAARRLGAATGCKILYTLKPLANAFLLELMRPWVDGFSASSLYEAKLARAAVAPGGSVHITTPGFRAGELAEIDGLCDFVAFNSLSQLRRFGPSLRGASKTGLRVNPRLSLVDDDRYDPCRKHSKLGVPIGQVRAALDEEPELLTGVRGLHFHTNCDSDDFGPWLATVRRVEKRLGDWLGRLEWVNLGGGYLLDPGIDTEPLARAVEALRSRAGVDVYVEPGAAFVRAAGSLVTEVIDLFRSSGKTVAVLDTTINHWPEIFEYQFEPDVAGHADDGRFEYVLAGSSCLAGDVLGEYAFGAPLEIGSRLVLPNVGAYSMVKAHMFNGINLPAVYSVTAEGGLVLRRRFTFDDFSSRTGVATDASV